MYVILVNPDNTLYGSVKQRVMQRSKLIDTLKFVVDPIYNGIDMTNASVLLEYILPISKKYETVYLELCDERYNDCYLQYKLPFDTNLTSEHGTVELQLTFAYAEMGADGEIVQRIRKTSATTIEIVPISKWSDIVPDSALGGLDQRLIVMNSQIQALDDYMNVLDSNQVDNLVYNEKDDTLQLSAKGMGVGDKVSVKDMLDEGSPVVDLNSKPEDKPNDDDESTESNVVEF